MVEIEESWRYSVDSMVGRKVATKFANIWKRIEEKIVIATTTKKTL